MTENTTVWLIDDSELINHLTTHTLQINKFASHIRSFTNPHEALAELEASVETLAFPDYIFLDLNMPGLDGWEFLYAYRKFPKEVKERCILYILSSSVDEDDINKSKLYEEVRDFLTKPLNRMDLEGVCS